MKNGFTLVELLAILVLISIIIIVAVPIVINSNQTALENQIEEYNETVKMACESYKAVTGNADINVEGLKNAGYLKSSLQKPDDSNMTVKAITECPE